MLFKSRVAHKYSKREQYRDYDNGTENNLSVLQRDMMKMLVIHMFVYFIYVFVSINFGIGDDEYTQNASTVSSHKLVRPPSKINTGINMNMNMNINRVDEENPKKMMQTQMTYETGFPKVSRLHYFPTHATEQEMAKHDRYLIHGILYTDMLSKEYLNSYWSTSHGSNSEDKKISINIFMKNRSLPYINALVTSLMGSHEQDETKISTLVSHANLLKFAEFHLLDTERRPHKLNYDYIRQKIFQLPFLQFHKTRYHFHFLNFYHNLRISPPSSSARLDKIRDYIHAAQVCIQSNTRWCLMMQEYTIVPFDFLSSLQNFVLAPLQSLATSHTSSYSQNNDILNSHFSIISLFSTIQTTPTFSNITNVQPNSFVKHQVSRYIDISNISYSANNYEFDKGKINSFRKALNLPLYKSEYKLHATVMNEMDGYNVASLIQTSMIQKSLLPFLYEVEKKEMAQLWREWWKRWIQFDSHPDNSSLLLDGHKIQQNNNINRKRTNHFDLEKEFEAFTGIQRYHLEPSLVNRIGFYDEDLEEGHGETMLYSGRMQKANNQRLGISNWITDPRFIFEASEYIEGFEKYCQTEDGHFYYDYYWDRDDDKKSTCNEEEEESED